MKKLLIYFISILFVSCNTGTINPSPKTGIIPIRNIPSKGGEEYAKHKTFIVDHDSSKNNYLVRGNEPLDANGHSAYDSINQKLQDTLGKAFDLTKYTFIDISLISSIGNEKYILFDEFLSYGYPLDDTLSSYNLTAPMGWPPFQGWNSDSTKGAPWNTYWLYGNKLNVNGKMQPGFFIWWPIQPCSDTTSTRCDPIVSSQYGFPNLIVYIKKLMKESKNTVIYFHCIHGHDRTSTVACAYQIKYQKKTFEYVTTTAAPLGGLPVYSSGKLDYLQTDFKNMLYVWNRDFKNQ